jgi:REP element-mobilizing transposase RayT
MQKLKISSKEIILSNVPEGQAIGRNKTTKPPSPVRDEIKRKDNGKYLHTNTHTCNFCCAKPRVYDSKQWKDELYKYISAIIKNNRHKMLSINGMPDHVHILFGMRPAQSLSDLMQDIKGSSSKWINDKNL